MKARISSLLLCLTIWLLFFTLQHHSEKSMPEYLEEMRSEHMGAYDNDESTRYIRENIDRTPEEWMELWQKVNAMPTAKEDIINERGGNGWTVAGPFGADDATMIPVLQGTKMTGRVRDLAQVTPLDGNDAGIRVLSASGGVWRVNTSGTTELISKDLLPQYLGSFAFSPLNADTIWVGSGEPGTACGMGLFRSNNGGATWTSVSLGSSGTPCTFHKIRYQPNSPNIIHAATNTGYFRSEDWGNTWTQISGGNVTDIVFHPTVPDTLYGSIAGMGLAKSADKGLTWNEPVGQPVLPANTLGDVKLAIAPSQPNILYASIANQTGGTIGIFKSVNSGATWNEMLIQVWDSTGIVVGQYDLNQNYHWGNQGWYDNAITVSPTDPNLVSVGGAAYLHSNNGSSFDWSDALHEDIHRMLWLNNFNGAMLLASDGGVFISFNGGAGFTSAFFQTMPITQFYDFEVSDSNPQYMIGGTQDNGLIYRNLTGWKTNRGGDGFMTAINPDDPNWMYGTNFITNNDIRVSSNAGGTGLSTDWSWEIIDTFNMNKHVRHERANSITWPYINAVLAKNNRQIYYRDLLGAWVSMNPGNQTSTEIWNFAVSNRPTSQDWNNIYFCHGPKSPQNEKIGIRWRNDGNWYLSNNVSGLPADTCTFFRVYTHPKEFDVAYAIVMRAEASCGQTGKIYITTDAAISWQDITFNLPKDVTYRSLVAHPNSINDIVVSTQGMGFFKLSMANGDTTWYKWDLGAPKNIEATALDLIDSAAVNGKVYVVAGTYGHGVWMREWWSADPVGIASAPASPAYDISEARYGNEEIAFELSASQPGNIEVTVFDMGGKKIKTLFYGPVYPNQNQLIYLNPKEFSSGIYICTLVASKEIIRSRKIRIISH